MTSGSQFWADAVGLAPGRRGIGLPELRVPPKEVRELGEHLGRRHPLLSCFVLAADMSKIGGNGQMHACRSF